MNNQPSLLHLLRYFGRDSATRVFGLLTLVVYIILVPGMYLVDRYNYGRSHAYIGSAGETTFIINITFAVAWSAIIVYTIFKYRKYVRSSR
jgi:hypothetical protein